MGSFDIDRVLSGVSTRLFVGDDKSVRDLVDVTDDIQCDVEGVWDSEIPVPVTS